MTSAATRLGQKKALIVAGQLVVGGAERELSTFLAAARNRGWEFEVLCLTAGGAFQPEVERRIGREVRVAPTRNRLARWRWIRHAIMAWQPDIVHAWNVYPMFYLKRMFLRRPCPIIGFLQNTPDDMGEGSFQWLFRDLVRCPDGLVSNSAAALAGLVRMGIRVAPTVVVRNGVDRAFFEGRPTPEVLARRGALRICVGAGRMIPRKRMEWMIRAVGRLRAEGMPCALWLVGDGPARLALETLTDELQLRDRVVFWGMRQDVPAILSGADVFVHCAWAEGLPNAVQEAMAVGLPIVASRASGVPELVDHEVHGLLFEPHDFEGFVQVLRRVLADPAARARMGRAARARAAAEYQPERMADRLLAFYEETIARFRARRGFGQKDSAEVGTAKSVVLYVGPRGPAVGGMVSYTEGYLASPLAVRYELRILPTDLLGKSKHRGLARGLLNVINGMGLAMALAWRLATLRPAIVHIATGSYRGFYEKSFLAALARLGGRRVAMHVHGAEFDRFLRTGWAWRHWLLRRLLRINHVVLALSESWAQVLRQAGLPEGRFAVVPNAVRVPPDDFRQRPGAASPPACRALFLNTLHARKGIREFVEASILVCRGHPEFQANVHGPDSPLARELQTRIQAEGLADRIRFLGTVAGAAKAAAFRTADFYVLPSHAEGVPLGLLEAMAHGLPCIATPVGGIPEVIRHGENGWLVGPGDIPGLRDAMKNVVQDRQLRERLGREARQTIAARFSWEVAAQVLADVYERLLRRQDMSGSA